MIPARASPLYIKIDYRRLSSTWEKKWIDHKSRIITKVKTIVLATQNTWSQGSAHKSRRHKHGKDKVIMKRKYK